MDTHDVETISITRFRIGEYTLDWTQSPQGAPCFLRANHPRAETRSRWVGNFSVPSGWTDGSDPKGAAAWTRAGFTGHTAVCLNCAKLVVGDLASAMDDYERRRQADNRCSKRPHRRGNAGAAAMNLLTGQSPARWA